MVGVVQRALVMECTWTRGKRKCRFAAGGFFELQEIKKDRRILIGFELEIRSSFFSLHMCLIISVGVFF